MSAGLDRSHRLSARLREVQGKASTRPPEEEGYFHIEIEEANQIALSVQQIEPASAKDSEKFARLNVISSRRRAALDKLI